MLKMNMDTSIDNIGYLCFMEQNNQLNDDSEEMQDTIGDFQEHESKHK